MTEDRKIYFEESHSPESLRCLFAWALYSEENKEKAREYETAAIKATAKIPFRPAAESWRRMIIECRWIAERSDDFDIID